MLQVGTKFFLSHWQLKKKKRRKFKKEHDFLSSTYFTVVESHIRYGCCFHFQGIKIRPTFTCIQLELLHSALRLDKILLQETHGQILGEIPANICFIILLSVCVLFDTHDGISVFSFHLHSFSFCLPYVSHLLFVFCANC